MMLSQVCKIGIESGCRRVTGWFLPTPKNEPASKIYPGNGFARIEESDSGSLWALRLPEQSIQKPEWIA
jgi:predicted enzyme involved in methoxymalonyl-ACP biosynthesis